MFKTVLVLESPWEEGSVKGYSVSQFPDILQDAVGEFHKPPGW